MSASNRNRNLDRLCPWQWGDHTHLGCPQLTCWRSSYKSSMIQQIARIQTQPFVVVTQAHALHVAANVSLQVYWLDTLVTPRVQWTHFRGASASWCYASWTLGCPFDIAWCLVCELCRSTVVWADCRRFLSLVFLSGARRLELSPCNTTHVRGSERQVPRLPSHHTQQASGEGLGLLDPVHIRWAAYHTCSQHGRRGGQVRSVCQSPIRIWLAS